MTGGGVSRKKRRLSIWRLVKLWRVARGARLSRFLCITAERFASYDHTHHGITLLWRQAFAERFASYDHTHHGITLLWRQAFINLPSCGVWRAQRACPVFFSSPRSGLQAILIHIVGFASKLFDMSFFFLWSTNDSSLEKH
jgi:hypothetical protein